MVRKKVVEKPIEVRHPLYWETVWLALRAVGGVVALPLFVLGLVVRGYRRIVDRIKEAVAV
jgi:hypothetical protein